MEDVPLSLLSALGALVVLSAFFSSAAAALSGLNKVRIRNLAEEDLPGSKMALQMAENIDHTLPAILSGNYLANVAAVGLSVKASMKVFGAGYGLAVSIFGMTAILLLFGEILPKAIVKEHAEAYAMRISWVLLPVVRILSPVAYLFGTVRNAAARVFSKGKPNAHSVTEEEIKVMVELSEEEGVIDKEEKELVHRSLEFNDITVGEVLTPRPDMIAVEAGMPSEKIKDVFLKERYSRIPVYDKDIDNIIGILSERDFFAQLLRHGEADVRSLLRKPKFVVKSMKISALLLEMQQSNVHMSIVIDEFGGTSGLITLEDILEQLVGDIWDEHDEVVSLITKLDERTYEVSPQVPLDDFAEEMGVRPIESAFHNLGGWIFGKLDRIPVVGDAFEYEHLRIAVAEVDKKRVKRIRVDVGDKAEE